MKSDFGANSQLEVCLRRKSTAGSAFKKSTQKVEFRKIHPEASTNSMTLGASKYCDTVDG